jgi:hypothetical protein
MMMMLMVMWGCGPEKKQARKGEKIHLIDESLSSSSACEGNRTECGINTIRGESERASKRE